MMEVIDIESLFGPNWDENLHDLCNLLSHESPECAVLKSIKVGPIAGGEIDGCSEISAQQLEHLGQVAMTKRFQYY